MPDFILISCWLLVCYLLGTLALGDFMSQYKGIDIRSFGTMNPGATNIYRALGLKYGISIFILDVSKGLLATLVPIFLFDYDIHVSSLAMFSLMAGHILKSPWGKTGGTGMATTMGACCGILPLGALISLPPSFLVLLVTKNTTYSGIFAFLFAIISGWLVQGNLIQVLSVLVAAGAVLLKYRVQYNNVSEEK